MSEYKKTEDERSLLLKKKPQVSIFLFFQCETFPAIFSTILECWAKIVQKLDEP